MKKVILFISILLFIFIIFEGIKQQSDYLTIGGGILLGFSIRSILPPITNKSVNLKSCLKKMTTN